MPEPATPTMDTILVRALATGRVEHVLEQAELAVAAEERRLELVAPSAAAAFGDDADRAERRHRRFLALEDLLARRFEGDRLVRGTFGGLADQNCSGCATDCSREAVLTRSPATMPWFVAPKRDCRFTGQDPGASADAGPSVFTAATTSSAARTARSASFSRAIGVPHTAMTASPMNFSIVPP